MRCSVKGCGITCKHPQKSMCWRKFSMCKYCACKLHPEAYTVYRAISNQFEDIVRTIENKKVNITKIT